MLRPRLPANRASFFLGNFEGKGLHFGITVIPDEEMARKTGSRRRDVLLSPTAPPVEAVLRFAVGIR